MYIRNILITPWIGVRVRVSAWWRGYSEEAGGCSYELVQCSYIWWTRLKGPVKAVWAAASRQICPQLRHSSAGSSLVSPPSGAAPGQGGQGQLSLVNCGAFLMSLKGC